MPVLVPIVVACILLHIGFGLVIGSGGKTGLYAFKLREMLLFQPIERFRLGDLPDLQMLWMFVTYGFLHVTWAHLIMNSVFILLLGHLVMERVDRLGFLIIYVGAIIAGGTAFAMSGATVPMAGASGAIYGLAGAIMYWNWADNPGQIRRYAVPAFDAVLLAGGNLGYYLATDGAIAWQAHLGGCLAGIVYAALQPGTKNAAP